MVTTKYVYDNVKSIAQNNGFVPYSCTSFMENGILRKPYNRKVYTSLFGMTEKELCALFAEMDIHEIRQFALERFKNWTQHDNDTLFKTDISLPWLQEPEWLV